MIGEVDAQKREAAAFLEKGLANNEAQALRENLARAIPHRLAENGLRLYLHYEFGERNAAGTGFATMTEMAAELGEGAVALFDADLWYPGAALVRQLIECGYLLALAAERREEAADWMRSTPKQSREQFSAGNMRNRSVRNFRLSEYQVHWGQGGHPTPAGRVLLRHHDQERPASHRVSWSDLTQHLAEIWQGFCAALPLYDPRCEAGGPLFSPERSPDGGDEIDALLTKWRKDDPWHGNSGRFRCRSGWHCCAMSWRR
jgi:hypothetical protein